jgi:hypothetical protein
MSALTSVRNNFQWRLKKHQFWFFMNNGHFEQAKRHWIYNPAKSHQDKHRDDGLESSSNQDKIGQLIEANAM